MTQKESLDISLADVQGRIENYTKEIASERAQIKKFGIKQHSDARLKQLQYSLEQTREQQKYLKSSRQIAVEAEKNAKLREKEEKEKEKKRQAEKAAKEKQKAAEEKERQTAEAKARKATRTSDSTSTYQHISSSSTSDSSISTGIQVGDTIGSIIAGGLAWETIMKGLAKINDENNSYSESLPQQTLLEATTKPIDPDEEFYNVYTEARTAIYNQAKEQIKANRNISPDKFCEWYKVAEYWSDGPYPASGLQKKAEILKKYVKSPSICAKMDGMIDLSKLFQPEYERLIQLLMKNESYWSHPDIRSHYPGMCATGKQVAEEIRIEKAEAKKKAQEKADNIQPWYLLLSLTCAISCLVLICVGQEYCLLITIIVCGGLIYLYKKHSLKSCSDWNPIHIWKRFMQNRKK